MELVRGISDLDGLFELLDEHVVWDNARHAPLDLDGIYRGKKAVTKMAKKWVGTWADYRFEIAEVIDAGDSVVLVINEGGKGVGSGVPLEQQYGLIWTFEDRRIVRGATFKTKSEALEAAGLAE